MADRAKHSRGHGREIGGIILLAIGLFTAAALVSLQVGDGTVMGPLGRLLARSLYALIGIAADVATVVLVVVAVRLLAGRPLVRGAGEAAGLAGGIVSLAILLHLIGAGHRIAGYGAGGLLGEYLAEVLRAVVSTAGTALVATVGLTVSLIVTIGLKVGVVGRGLERAARATVAFVAEVVRNILPDRERDKEDDEPAFEKESTRVRPPKKMSPAAAALAAAPPPPPGDDDSLEIVPPSDPPRVDDTVRVGPPDMSEPVKKPRRPRVKPSPAVAVAAVATSDDTDAEAPLTPEQPPSSAAVDEAVAVASAVAAAPAPLIVQPAYMKAKPPLKDRPEGPADFIPLGEGGYQLPSLSLLQYDESGITIDKGAMLENAARLVKTLGDYGVKGEVQAIRPGPVVTMYEFAPAPGTRVAKISNLADDLAMALEAMRIRIVAPIPGKAAVGIEVPNKHREIVYLKEILADDTFTKAKSRLSIALGKDIEGRPVAVNLAKMPHLLVAGTTGAGKSVGINAMIMSLLFAASPEEVRLIMVDPKMLELSIYEGIPHLLLPVVTDPKKANLALKWAVEEMERRYEHLAEAGVRDIASYNRKCDMRKGVMLGGAPTAGPTDETQQVSTEPAQLDHPVVIPQSMKKLPYIVIVIDEFADLMMCAPKEIETSVARIAQKARACGIHLLLATQRPSVDVITGLIKANFPSRIAFQVTSKIDSRTILDQSGAEALLGQGDMLFSDRGGALKRVHGCLVQDEEIVKVVDLLKKQGKPVYDMEILKPREDDEEADVHEEDFADDMYDRAVALVSETRQASISMIQRRLRIGYNRAARMVERMEREGIVGPGDGPNRREVLVQAHG